MKMIEVILSRNTKTLRIKNYFRIYIETDVSVLLSIKPISD